MRRPHRGPCGPAARLFELIGVGEGHAGAGGVPGGVEVVTGIHRQVIGLAVQLRGPAGCAAHDGDVAQCLQRPAGSDWSQRLRRLSGGMGSGDSRLQVAPVHGSESCRRERFGEERRVRPGRRRAADVRPAEYL